MEGVTRAGRGKRNFNEKKPVGSKLLKTAERKIRRKQRKGSSKGNELLKGKIGDSKEEGQIRSKTLTKQREQLSQQVSPEITPKRNLKFKFNAKSEPNILKPCLFKNAHKIISPNRLVKNPRAIERHSTGFIENRIAKMKTQLEHLQNHITTFTERCNPLKTMCLNLTG